MFAGQVIVQAGAAQPVELQVKPEVTLMVSMFQPTAAMVQSDAKRKRSLMFCPFAAAGRLTVVVKKPPDFPDQAWRPAMGLWKFTLIMLLYPPVTKLPPAVIMSVKAPAPMAISSTPPSKVLSESKLFLKVSRALADDIAMAGVSSVESVMQLGSL